jgi:hypothetical protein
MFKRLSIVTLSLSGLLLAGCANQQSADLKTSSDKTEQTTSNTPKKSTKSNQTTKSTKSTKSTDETASSEKEDPSKESDSNQTQQDQTTSQTTTDQTQDQSDNQQDQTQQSVNLTTSQEAVEFLADKLSTTYDRSTTQYVANGKVTWNDVNGYQINIYSKNSDSPVGSYLVPANGQYFQIW